MGMANHCDFFPCLTRRNALFHVFRQVQLVCDKLHNLNQPRGSKRRVYMLMEC